MRVIITLVVSNKTLVFTIVLIGSHHLHS